MITVNRILSDALFVFNLVLFPFLLKFFIALSTTQSSLGPYLVNNFLIISVAGSTIAVSINPIADKTV